MDEYVTDNNPVHVIEALVDDLDLAAQGSAGVAPRGDSEAHTKGPTNAKYLVIRYQCVISNVQCTGSSNRR